MPSFGNGWRGFAAQASVALGRRKGAYVFDLDATLLSAKTAPAFRGPQDAPAFDAWANAGTADPIEVTRPLYEQARRKGHEVHFITARSPATREGTVRNLEQAGFGHFDSLIMKPDGVKTAPYKAAARKEIVDRGREILFNVGDVASDFEGGWFHKGVQVFDESRLAPYKLSSSLAKSTRSTRQTMIEGLRHGGIAQKLRRLFTAFGSGWRGLQFSKAVQEDGTPKRVYHGTGGIFDWFDVEKTKESGNLFGYGNYFTEDPRMASEYADDAVGRGRGFVENSKEHFPWLGDAKEFRQKNDPSAARAWRLSTQTDELYSKSHYALMNFEASTEGELAYRRFGFRLQGVAQKKGIKLKADPWSGQIHKQVLKAALRGNLPHGHELFQLGLHDFSKFEGGRLGRLHARQRRLDNLRDYRIHRSDNVAAEAADIIPDESGSGYRVAWKRTQANVRAAHLNIERPLDLDAPVDPEFYEHVSNHPKWQKTYGSESGRTPWSLVDKHGKPRTNENLYDAFDDALLGRNHVNDELQKIGYDGLTHIGGNRMGRGEHLHRVWIAFRNDQVKNAFTHQAEVLPEKTSELAKLHAEVPHNLKSGYKAFVNDVEKANYVVTDVLKQAHLGVIEGLKHGGMAEKLRHLLTNFGSGWRGLVSLPDELMVQPGLSFGRKQSFEGLTLSGKEYLDHWLNHLEEAALKMDNWRGDRILRDIAGARDYYKRTGFIPVFVNEELRGAELKEAIRHERLHAADYGNYGHAGIAAEREGLPGFKELNDPYLRRVLPLKKDRVIQKEWDHEYGGPGGYGDMPTDFYEKSSKKFDAATDRMIAQTHKMYESTWKSADSYFPGLGKAMEDSERLAYSYGEDKKIFGRLQAAGVPLPQHPRAKASRNVHDALRPPPAPEASTAGVTAEEILERVKKFVGTESRIVMESGASRETVTMANKSLNAARGARRMSRAL